MTKHSEDDGGHDTPAPHGHGTGRLFEDACLCLSCKHFGFLNHLNLLLFTTCFYCLFVFPELANTADTLATSEADLTILLSSVMTSSRLNAQPQRCGLYGGGLMESPLAVQCFPAVSRFDANLAESTRERRRSYLQGNKKKSSIDFSLLYLSLIPFTCRSPFSFIPRDFSHPSSLFLGALSHVFFQSLKSGSLVLPLFSRGSLTEEQYKAEDPA